jgi:hypothetical protein
MTHGSVLILEKFSKIRRVCDLWMIFEKYFDLVRMLEFSFSFLASLHAWPSDQPESLGMGSGALDNPPGILVLLFGSFDICHEWHAISIFGGVF